MLILENGAVVPRRLRRKTEARFDPFIAAFDPGGNIFSDDRPVLEAVT